MVYTLRASTAKDRVWLEALRRDAYRDLFDQTWGGWDEERHQRHFSACWERGRIQVIETDTSPVGMLQLFETDDAIEIGEIQISPSCQGQGLGTRILRDIIERAQKTSKNLTLSTGLKNTGAQNLYRKLGFEETKRTETHVHMTHTTSPAPDTPASGARGKRR